MKMDVAPLFQSFLQGGFESSSQRWHDGRRLDLIAACRHDTFAFEDYSLLRRCGLSTVRDALRWHLIESVPGRYDWSSFLPMLRAAREADIQVIWDLCHYGLPDWLDIWSGDFVPRFAAFAAAAAALVREESGDCGPAPVYAVMNEISFWACYGGDRALFHPCGQGQGDELKRRLVRAAIAATDAVRGIDPRARFVQPEPAIHIVAHASRPDQVEEAERRRLAQFQAFDMLTGRIQPELGGREDLLDIVGVNFYWNNQWIMEAPPLGQEETLGFGHPAYRPFGALLAEIHERYHRPMLVSETGAEGPSGPAWIGHIAGEVRNALKAGVPVLGICLYPVMDYPGWADDRHCACGLIEASEGWRRRLIRPEILDRLEEEAEACRAVLALSHRSREGAAAR
jgi:beta-glucosidase/6-phospho-beta-glucosidase/beta-galactosidase